MAKIAFLKGDKPDESSEAFKTVILFESNYDKLGQLTNALFKGNNSSGWNYRNDAFSEKNISYDLNGNMLPLERNMLNLSSKN